MEGIEKPRRKKEQLPTELPTGSKWLSHTLDVMQSARPRHVSAYTEAKLYRQAIEELQSLDGGAAAYRHAVEQFREKKGRQPGDTQGAREALIQRFPDAAALPWTPDDHAEQDKKDWDEIAYEMTRAFGDEHNPCTPRFLERFAAEHEAAVEAIHDEADKNLFREALQDAPGYGYSDADEIGHPTQEDLNAHTEAFSKRWGSRYEEIEFDADGTDPEAAEAALATIAGHAEANQTAIKEWELLEELLKDVKPWHNFPTDRDNYVVRRTNTLLGSPIRLAPFEFTERDLTSNFTKYHAESMNCDAVLQFLDLYNIPHGKQHVLQTIEQLLEEEPGYSKVVDHLEKEGTFSSRNYEVYVRRLNQLLNEPVQLAPSS